MTRTTAGNRERFAQSVAQLGVSLAPSVTVVRTTEIRGLSIKFFLL